MARGRGFRLIDLLIVVGVIGLLVGLLLPARRNVAAAAHRTRSMNNIRQIGIAIENYKDGNDKRFPLSVDWTPDGIGAPTGMGYCSLFFSIMPQLESSNVYNTFSFANANASATYAGPSGSARIVIKSYISPADPSSVDGDIVTGVDVTAPTLAVRGWSGSVTNGTYATCSYAANGLVFRPGTTEKSLKDGLTNTIFIAERYQKCYYSPGTDAIPQTSTTQAFCLWGLGAYSSATPSFCTPYPTAEGYPTSTTGKNSNATGPVVHALNQFYPVNKDGEINVPDDEKGAVPGRVGTAAVADFKEFGKAISATPGFQVAPRGTVMCDARVPQTPHVGGMIVGLGDASARTVSPTISAYTFYRACTPAGDEKLGEDW